MTATDIACKHGFIVCELCTPPAAEPAQLTPFYPLSKYAAPHDVQTPLPKYWRPSSEIRDGFVVDCPRGHALQHAIVYYCSEYYQSTRDVRVREVRPIACIGRNAAMLYALGCDVQEAQGAPLQVRYFTESGPNTLHIIHEAEATKLVSYLTEELIEGRHTTLQQP